MNARQPTELNPFELLYPLTPSFSGEQSQSTDEKPLQLSFGAQALLPVAPRGSPWLRGLMARGSPVASL